jgi:uncharacterized protein (TIGR03086 family)
MTPPLEALTRARDVLRAALNGVKREDLARSTPCDQWVVREVIEHLVIAEAAVAPMLGLGDASPPGVDVQADPVGAWSIFAALADAAFTRPGALSAEVEHPYIGQITGERLLWMRVVDNVLHGWDIARAVGVDDKIPDDLVHALAQRAEASGTRPADTGLFAPAPDVAPDADPQTRLLAHYGRSRDWSRR